MTLKLVDKLF